MAFPNGIQKTPIRDDYVVGSVEWTRARATPADGQDAAGTSPGGIQKTPIRDDYVVGSVEWTRARATPARDENAAGEREARLSA